MTSPTVTELTSKFGITRLANLTGLDRVGYPVVAAIRPLSRNLSVSLGKGATLEQAEISAVMEAVELNCSESPVVEPLNASFNDLPRGLALDPANLEVVDRRLDSRAVPLEWVPARSLVDDKDIWVPWQAVSMDYSASVTRPTRVLRASGTGLAASWDRSEACLHGLYEAIERDCHTDWNDLGDEARLATLIKFTGLGCDSLEQTLLLVQKADLDIWVWDMTNGYGVPCYLVELLDFALDAPTAYAQGAAAHLVRETAIEKALGEALQVRLTYISGSRDDLAWSDYGSRYDAVVNSRRRLSRVPPVRRLLKTSQPTQTGTASTDVAELCTRMQFRSTMDAIEVPLSAAGDAACAVKILTPRLQDTPEADHFEKLRRHAKDH